MKPIKDCETVAELLCDESRWTKGRWARDDKGSSVSEQSSSAVCFCLLGAISRIYQYKYIDVSNKLYELLNTKGYKNITYFNDVETTTFADIQAIIKEANI